MFRKGSSREIEDTFRAETGKGTRTRRYTFAGRDVYVSCELYDLDWIRYYWCPNVYKPSDDTLLLIELIENIRITRGRVLEIGTGTGIVLAYLLKNNTSLTGIGVDVNPFAAYNTYITLQLNDLDNRADVLNCESVTCIKKGLLFDIVLYNPPYLVGDPDTKNYNDIAELGGSEGINNLMSVLEKLLRNKNIDPESEVYIIIPEPPPLERILERLKKLGFNIKILKTKHFFYEKIHGARLELKQGVNLI